MNKKYLYISLIVAAIIIIGAILLPRNKTPVSTSREYSSTDVAGLSASQPT